ncbi:hypothetical protein [Rhizobium phage RHph_X2_28B]|uniref:hypothetical protein n=1 Tax=Rhizobium phage RHph_X2_28B TaxID=2836086 RepID=UPI00232933B5|nr:hypothetical protein PP751_gp013 [Rhizobium phage RHph_X2_28B]QWY83465.1 hypothetical protein [Rhizobium phage RHph_X2_28B]QWY83701.1 hypothetical protein [Rhizobium phage RHph_X3_15]
MQNVKNAIVEIQKALMPLVEIADAYDKDEFSEKEFNSVWMYHANMMVTLEQCMFAREVYNNLQKKLEEL